MSDIVKLVAPVATVLSAAIPAATSLLSKTPKTPKLNIPTLAPTPTMPTPNDDASKAAALQTIAKRSTQHGRDSTNLYEKLG